MKRYYSVALSLLFSTALLVACSHHNIIEEPTSQLVDLTTPINPSQSAEYHTARTILVHTPGSELECAMLHPSAALFDTYFSIEEAQREHDAYCEELSTEGIRVLHLRDLLLKGTQDTDGAALDSLRAFASKILVYDTSSLTEVEAAEQEAYKAESIAALSPTELVSILLMQPTIVLSPTEFNTGITATYTYNPLMNLFYTRDQMITTAKGVVLCKMNSSQRQSECEIMRYALSRMGIEPIYEVVGDGAFMEGGDYLVAENCSFIGCGMRTTQAAIDQLLVGDYFGTDTVVVVRDGRFYQPQMHLDTYFNIIDSDLVTLVEERIDAVEGSDCYVTADMYVSGERVIEGVSFVELLTDNFGYTIIPITGEDQDHFANNFLTVAPRKIMAVANQSDELEERFAENGVEVKWVELENLILGYGAAHCMTQVLERN